jgi:hypothetical protein
MAASDTSGLRDCRLACHRIRNEKAFGRRAFNTDRRQKWRELAENTRRAQRKAAATVCVAAFSAR